MVGVGLFMLHEYIVVNVEYDILVILNLGLSGFVHGTHQTFFRVRSKTIIEPLRQ